MDCKDCRGWLTGKAEPPSAVLAHLEGCPSCRKMIDRELAGEPLPLRTLPLLELPGTHREAPRLPVPKPDGHAGGESETAPTDWSGWFGVSFGASFGPWLPAMGMMMALVGIGALLINPWPQTGVNGPGPAPADVASLPRLAVAATVAAGPEWPDPVFASRDARSEPALFEGSGAVDGGESDDGYSLENAVLMASTEVAATGAELPGETLNGSEDSVAELIRFMQEPVKAVSFVNEERVPTFFDLNQTEEETSNG